jgi:periplasmic divalent cation tolerance protein
LTPMDNISVYIVAANPAEATAIAEMLIRERLAACVNILGAIQSIYRWNGGIERGDEVAMIAKSRRRLFDVLAAKVRAMHSYDVPAIVAWPIIAGDAEYLGWIDAETDTLKSL